MILKTIKWEEVNLLNVMNLNDNDKFISLFWRGIRKNKLGDMKWKNTM